MLSDSNFVRQPSQRLDAHKTIFVGALHGMISAETLSVIMNDLFANVVYAGIDTDKHKYPIGKFQAENVYRNVDTRKICCNHPQIWTRRLCHKIMCPKGADRMANSIDPDLGLHYLPRPVCPKN